jgi:hypothetical protein
MGDNLYLEPVRATQQTSAGFVPHPCQNGRETAIISGDPRATSTASGLGTHRLTPCLKRPSNQRVSQDERMARRYR